MKTFIKGITTGVIFFILISGGIFFVVSLEEKNALKTRISIIEKQYEYFYNKFRNSRVILNSLLKGFEEASGKLEYYKGEIGSLEKKLKNSRNELQKMVQDKETLRISKSDVQNKLNLTLQETKKIKQRRELPLQEKLKKIEQALGEKNRELVELEENLNDTLKDNQSLTKNNKTLQNKINKLKSEKDNLYGELKDLKVLLSKQNNTQNNIDSLNKKNKELEARFSLLSRDLERKNQEIVTLMVEKEKLEADVPKLQVEKLYLERELNLVKSKHQQAVILLDEISYFNSAVKEKLGKFSQSQKDNTDTGEFTDKSKEESPNEVSNSSKRTVDVLLIP